MCQRIRSRKTCDLYFKLGEKKSSRLLNSWLIKFLLQSLGVFLAIHDMSAYIIKRKWVAFSFHCKNKVYQPSLIPPMPVLCCGGGKGAVGII